MKLAQKPLPLHLANRLIPKGSKPALGNGSKTDVCGAPVSLPVPGEWIAISGVGGLGHLTGIVVSPSASPKTVDEIIQLVRENGYTIPVRHSELSPSYCRDVLAFYCRSGLPVGLTGRQDFLWITSKPETIGLKMRTGDPGVVGKRSPAVALLDLSSFTHTAPNCCYWRVPVLLPTQHPCP